MKLAALAAAPLLLAVSLVAHPVTPGKTFQAYLMRHSHLGCGKAQAWPVWRGNTVTQRYNRCVIRATFSVTRMASPRPAPPTATPRPQPSPTPYPTAAPPIPTATPRPVACSGQDCADALLGLINTDRAQAGVAPLSLDSAMSLGSGSCIGALGHSAHMAATGVLAHDQFPADVCYPFQNAEENIGEGSGAVWPTLQALHAQMMAEPHSPGCSGNHACNLLSPTVSHIGIGIYVSGGAVWLTEDLAS